MNGLAATVCLGLSLSPAAPADAPAAGEAAASDGAPSEPDPGLIQAEALYEAGLTRFTAADYESAIELWLAAYDKIPDVIGSGQIRADIIYNVAKAQQLWFEIDRDPAHLRQAKAAMQSFADEIPSSYPPEQVDAELARSNELISRLDDMIVEAEQQARELELAKAERMRAKFDPVIDERERIRNRGMVISGAVFSATGAAGLALLGTGLGLALTAEQQVDELASIDELDERRAAFSRGRTGDVLIMTGAAVAGSLLLTGIPLLVVGSEYEKRRLRYKRSYELGIVPSPRGAALWVRF